MSTNEIMTLPMTETLYPASELPVTRVDRMGTPLIPSFARGRNSYLIPEGVSPLEAQARAGLCWDVVTSDMETYSADPSLHALSVPNMKAIIREDVGQVLGVASKRYTPIQNGTMFELIESALGSKARIKYSGFLNHGKRVFAYAEMESFEVIRNDHVSKGLLVTTSHDGTGSYIAALMSIRIFCQNQLAAAVNAEVRGRVRQADNRIRIRHTVNAADRLADLNKLLLSSDSYYEALQGAFRSLASKPIKSEHLIEFKERFLPLPIFSQEDFVPENPRTTVYKSEGVYQKELRRTVDLRRTLEHRLNGDAPGATTAGLTLWGLLNAWSDMDERPMSFDGKAPKSDSERDPFDVIEGEVATTRQEVFDYLVTLN